MIHRYAWHQAIVKDPRDYYLKLTARRVEMQDRARPGIQDPTQKEMWSTEWAALNAELDNIALQLNKSGGERNNRAVAVSPVRPSGGDRTVWCFFYVFIRALRIAPSRDGNHL